MATTIQVSKSLQEELMGRKLFDSESYEDVIWDMLEDIMEITKETKKILRLSEKDVKGKRIHALSDVKRELNV